MPYKDLDRRRLSSRAGIRHTRHGNWRQTYIDCLGMCVARVNGSEYPCGEVYGLEFHEIFGENGHRNDPSFQMRVLLCNFHHSLIEDRGHQSSFILDQYQPSCLAEDIDLEIIYAGGYDKWLEHYKLDPSRSGILLFSGPHVEDVGDG